MRTGNGTLSEARSRRPVIIRSADEVPRGTLLKRFPVPRNLGVSPESRIVTGRTWPAPAGATRVKAFKVYRYDPDSAANPRLDTFEVDLDDCGPTNGVNSTSMDFDLRGTKRVATGSGCIDI